MEVLSLWDARDEEGTECVLEQIDKTRFQLSMTEGLFSGYPTINLDRKHLKDLHAAIEHALNTD